MASRFIEKCRTLALRLTNWWVERQEKAVMTRLGAVLGNDEALIAELIPELSHRGIRDGTAYTFDQIDQFRGSCTPAELRELVVRLKAAQAKWEAAGVSMPYWENLIVLRALQADAQEWGKPPKVRAKAG